MGRKMNRRSFLQATVAASASALLFQHASAEDAPTVAAPGPADGLYPVVPGVTHAWSSIFTKTNKATILDEPIALSFWAFEFKDSAAATSGFGTIADFYHDYVAKDAADPVTETSIGKLGDQRKAFFDDSAAPKISAAIRVGSVVQASLAISFGGDLPTYMAALLANSLPTDDSDPSAFVPDISSLPPGWETAFAEPLDITAYASGAETPPTPQPTSTPVGSILPSEDVTAISSSGSLSSAPAPVPEGNTASILMTENTYSPSVLSVVAGRDVDIRITNTGVLDHDFNVPALSIATGKIVPGESHLVTVRSDRLGEYPFFCSFHGFEGMAGTLFVVES
jgi:plastocyanin